jgi:hypothetical protein
VTGPHGRLLYTSRDQGVITSTGAATHRVGVLSPAAARVMAAEILATTADALPDDADRAFTAVGHLPLAVVLLAAAVKGGRSWAEVDLDLARGTDVYGAHPYANTFRALGIGVGALPDDLRAALFGLAVFPPVVAAPAGRAVRVGAPGRAPGRRGRPVCADQDRHRPRLPGPPSRA